MNRLYAWMIHQRDLVTESSRIHKALNLRFRATIVYVLGPIVPTEPPAFQAVFCPGLLDAGFVFV